MGARQDEEMNVRGGGYQENERVRRVYEEKRSNKNKGRLSLNEGGEQKGRGES